MAIPSRQIGWGTESNLLWQILKQLTRLTNIMFGLKPKYNVFTALISQSGPYSILNVVQGDSVVKGITYTILTNSENADLTIFGAPNSLPGTSFICTVDGVIPVIGSISLEYNQGAPTAVVLENTIGNIWLNYVGNGKYDITSNSLFTNSKTFINGVSLDGIFVFNKLINEDATGFDYQRGYFLVKLSDSIVRLNTIIDVETFSDDIINNPICLEIRVYN